MLKKAIAKNFNNQTDIGDIADIADDIIEKDKMDLRAEKNKLYSICLRITQSKSFNNFIITCILLNTICLASDKYPERAVHFCVLEFCNMVFSIIFFIEGVIKLTGLGLKSYFKDAFNMIDMVIILTSFLDFYTFLTQEGYCFTGDFITEGGDKLVLKSDMHTNYFQIVKSIRLTRVFKLARSWTSFNYFLNTLGRTINKMASFGLILMVFMLIAAKFGQGIFAQKIRYDLDDNQIEYFAPLNNTVSRMHSVPESNFDSLTDSMISVFIVLTNDGWVAVYSEFYRFVSKTKSTIFFLSLVIIG